MKNFKDMARTGEVKRADVGMKVKLDDIHPEPDFNVRQQGEKLEEHIEGIKAFVLNGGTLPPLEVRPREEGGVWVVDGHCRREAYVRARNEGAPLEWIDIRPFHGNDADRVARMATSNEGLKLSPLETSFIYKRLRGMGLEVAQIAKLVNRTPQHVAHVLNLADANVELQQQVASGEVSASVAVDLHKKHGEKASGVVIQLREKTGGKKVTKSVAARTVTLQPHEIRALNALIAEYHEKWKKIASDYMEDDFRRNLEARLDDAM